MILNLTTSARENAKHILNNYGRFAAATPEKDAPEPEWSAPRPAAQGGGAPETEGFRRGPRTAARRPGPPRRETNARLGTAGRPGNGRRNQTAAADDLLSAAAMCIRLETTRGNGAMPEILNGPAALTGEARRTR